MGFGFLVRGQGLGSARHLIARYLIARRVFDPRRAFQTLVLSYMAAHEVASNIRQSVRCGGGGRAGAGADPGRAVQVDPIKPTLKAPGTKRSKLKYDEALLNFAFNFNMRRYILAEEGAAEEDKRHKVGRCRLTLSNPRSKRLELSA